MKRLGWPRAALALNPFLFPLSVSLTTVALVFTFWPDALDHSPIAFETRGFVHHAWHYALLAGAALTLLGILWRGRRQIFIELSGVAILIAVLSMNLLALVAQAYQPGEPAADGLAVTLRVALIVGLCFKAWTIITGPVLLVVRSGTGED